MTDLIQEKLGIKDVRKIQDYRKEIRDNMLRNILKIEGITITQTSRVLGVTRKMIYRAMKK